MTGPAKTVFEARPAGLEAPEPQEAPPASHAARALKTLNARREVTERRRITHRLRQALQNGGFCLHYQPAITFGSGMIRGAEAQIRLLHRRRGPIAAAQFMPVAERSEVIHDIGGWMLATACEEASHWPGELSVALGLTARQLQSGRVLRQVVEALSRSGLHAGRLELEVSEAMLMAENAEASETLKALHGLGARLSLSNFGTGYASLSALKRLPIATLRLDRTLVQNLGQSAADDAMVHAALEAGHALGCRVLADGVETERQFHLLGELGCDEAQGSYFSLAVPAAEITAMFGG